MCVFIFNDHRSNFILCHVVIYLLIILITYCLKFSHSMPFLHIIFFKSLIKNWKVFYTF